MRTTPNGSGITSALAGKKARGKLPYTKSKTAIKQQNETLKKHIYAPVLLQYQSMLKIKLNQPITHSTFLGAIHFSTQLKESLADFATTPTYNGVTIYYHCLSKEIN
jgi:hypothetical protein